MRVILDRLFDLLPIVPRKRWICFCGQQVNYRIKFHCCLIRMSMDRAHFMILFWTMIMIFQAAKMPQRHDDISD